MRSHIFGCVVSHYTIHSSNDNLLWFSIVVNVKLSLMFDLVLCEYQTQLSAEQQAVSLYGFNISRYK